MVKVCRWRRLRPSNLPTRSNKSYVANIRTSIRTTAATTMTILPLFESRTCTIFSFRLNAALVAAGNEQCVDALLICVRASHARLAVFCMVFSNATSLRSDNTGPILQKGSSTYSMLRDHRLALATQSLTHAHQALSFRAVCSVRQHSRRVRHQPPFHHFRAFERFPKSSRNGPRIAHRLAHRTHERERISLLALAFPKGHSHLASAARSLG